jgi:hypothetical protein
LEDISMATVNKDIADAIIAGKYAEADGWPIRIVEYTNAWGGTSYGVEHHERDRGRYSESEYVRNPRVYWEFKP